MFAQNYDNLRHDINNTLQLSAYGPQIITTDTYLSAYFNYSANYEWGRLNNTDSTGTYTSNLRFSHSLHLNFDMRVIGILHFAWNNSLDLSNLKFDIGDPWFYVNI